jgi:hypothetical protein
MEVHHHSHTSRKKWTHYFWEFLMLFLAVFCGFFAEYQLEHKIEKDRELQFMHTMAEDLKSDTAQLNSLITRRKKRIKELDTLFNLIENDAYLSMGRKIYELYELPHWDILRFFPSDRTMQQLKNGGNLRLIRKKNISNSLIGYDVWIRNRKEYESLQAELANQFNTILEKLIDPSIVNKATEEFNKKQFDSDTILSRKTRFILPESIAIPRLLDTDKKIILKYIYQVKTFYMEYLIDHISLKQLAIKTLNGVIKEYSIK